jgi:peptidoglycan hydrolase CwlO-like protein
MKELDILVLDLQQKLNQIDEVESQIEGKLSEIKNLKDPVEIQSMNEEIKDLLTWWKEHTGYDYEI